MSDLAVAGVVVLLPLGWFAAVPGFAVRHDQLRVAAVAAVGHTSRPADISGWWAGRSRRVVPRAATTALPRYQGVPPLPSCVQGGSPYSGAGGPELGGLREGRMPRTPDAIARGRSKKERRRPTCWRRPLDSIRRDRSAEAKCVRLRQPSGDGIMRLCCTRRSDLRAPGSPVASAH